MPRAIIPFITVKCRNCRNLLVFVSGQTTHWGSYADCMFLSEATGACFLIWHVWPLACPPGAPCNAFSEIF